MEDLQNHLGGFLNTYVLRDDVRELALPVHFVQGANDLNTPSVLVREYFDKLIAPLGKHWHSFDGTGHMAMYEDTERFLHVMKQASTQFRQ